MQDRNQDQERAQFESLRVAPNDTLRKVLRVLDSSAKRIVLVTDAERHLSGVITDGDIRRALLGDATLDTLAERIMTSDPLVDTELTERAALDAEIRQRGVLAVPVIRKGVVVGLQFVTDRDAQSIRQNPVVLMAGGRGSRLMPLTADCPKPLIRVGGTPILERVIRQLKMDGFRQFHICVNYLSEQIEDHFGDGESLGIRIEYVREDRPLGTVGALSLIDPNSLALPFLVMNADLLTTFSFADLLDFHVAKGPALTICTREYSHEIPFGVIDTEDAFVRSITEKPTVHRAVSAGIYAVSPEALAGLRKGEPLDMPALIESLIDHPKGVRTFGIHEYWLDIGRTSELDRAQADVLELSLPKAA